MRLYLLWASFSLHLRENDVSSLGQLQMKKMIYKVNSHCRGDRLLAVEYVLMRWYCLLNRRLKSRPNHSL